MHGGTLPAVRREARDRRSALEPWLGGERLELVDVRLDALGDQLGHPLLGGDAQVHALLGDGNRLLGGGLDVGQDGLRAWRASWLRCGGDFSVVTTSSCA